MWKLLPNISLLLSSWRNPWLKSDRTDQEKLQSTGARPSFCMSEGVPLSETVTAFQLICIWYSLFIDRKILVIHYYSFVIRNIFLFLLSSLPLKIGWVSTRTRFDTMTSDRKQITKYMIHKTAKTYHFD